MSEQPITAGDRVELFDGSALLYRSYHGNRNLIRPSDGMPVGAVFGVVQSLWRLIELQPCSWTHAGVFFDTPAQTFRHKLSDAYKSHRRETPDDLNVQRPMVLEALDAFGLHHSSLDGYEADDLIATVCRMAVEREAAVNIEADDKDLMCLIRPGVTMTYWHSQRKRRITAFEDEVIKRYGVMPTMLPDLLALIGDRADGIAGIPGIGINTASTLLNKYRSLDAVLDNAAAAAIGPTRRQALIDGAETARLARRLVRLDDNVPLPFSLDDLTFEPIDYTRLLSFCRSMEFPSFIKRIEAKIDERSASDSAATNGRQMAL